MSRSPALTALALSIAVLLPAVVLAQDHSSHHGHATPRAETEVEPEATAKSSDPAILPSTKPDPHADHAAHMTSPPVQDAHAGHAAPQQHGDHSRHAANPGTPSTPIPPVTDADRAAAFPPLHKHMEHVPAFNWYVGINRLEAWDADEGRGEAWEATAWFGTDLNRLWLRSEGERVDGHTESADVEVLYGRSVSAWWDVVGGVRQETRPGPSRSWAALGMQGLAPYKFEVQATAYVGNGGRVEANVEAEYELLLTNRLILQPVVELDFAAKDDEERGIGSGLSKAEAGLRLRYEFTRRFAPYIGVVHERTFGRTADLREADGEHAKDTRFVAGVRLWF